MKTIIADDHPLIRESLTQVLQGLAAGHPVLQATTAQETRDLLDRQPDTELLLLDLVMPGANGLELLEHVCRRYPDLKVIVLSASEDPLHMRRSLDIGACGFIPKSAPSAILLSAIQLVIDGGIYVPPELITTEQKDPAPRTVRRSNAWQTGITPRQREVLGLLTEGKSNKEIARGLDLSEHTVKIHVASILRALGVTNRTQAAIAAREQGLLEN